MNLHDRLLRLANALPSDQSSVTLTRADLISLLADCPSESDSITRDLTVDEVAKEVRRSPSTVRSWLWSGAMRGYKLNGRSWRIPRSALREYLDGQGRQGATMPTMRQEEERTDVDLGAWRDIRGLR